MSTPLRLAEPMARSLLLVALAAVILLAAFFRLQGLRWDAACPPDDSTPEAACTETHLHPDERFLTMALEIKTIWLMRYFLVPTDCRGHLSRLWLLSEGTGFQCNNDRAR